MADRSRTRNDDAQKIENLHILVLPLFVHYMQNATAYILHIQVSVIIKSNNIRYNKIKKIALVILTFDT